MSLQKHSTSLENFTKTNTFLPIGTFLLASSLCFSNLDAHFWIAGLENSPDFWELNLNCLMGFSRIHHWIPRIVFCFNNSNKPKYNSQLGYGEHSLYADHTLLSRIDKLLPIEKLSFVSILEFLLCFAVSLLTQCLLG